MDGSSERDGVTVPHKDVVADLRPDTVRGFRVELLEGPATGTAWESEGETCTIGSDAACDCVVADPTVSRFHCEVRVTEGGARVRDLGSRNGTIVDGVRVVDGYLRSGSALRLGGSVARFELLGKSHRLPVSERTELGELAGTSVAMRMAFALLERAAASEATVLLEGETGTGKSAAARSIHRESARSAGPFVTLDCGAVPANLLESELFGHERGAFTGATDRRIGAFEDAAGGTLLLDEIGELPLELQPKLLGILETRELRRVGGAAVVPVDVRVIAATNRDLRAEVNRGRFRPDLYFRLAVLKIPLPPLRHRPEDLPAIAARLLAGLGLSADRVDAMCTPELLASLRAASWPGNARELRNHLERCVIFDDALPVTDFEPATADQPARADVSLPFADARKRAIDAFEREYVTELLALHDGKVASAAAAAGIDRTYFYRLLRRHGHTP